MKVIRVDRIGIAQGETLLFSEFETNGPMWSGEGPREYRQAVRFEDAFAAPPTVTVGLSMWDISNGANSRADISAIEIDAQGLVLLFRTWGDTRVARIRASWLAIGPVADDDLWDV